MHGRHIVNVDQLAVVNAHRKPAHVFGGPQFAAQLHAQVLPVVHGVAHFGGGIAGRQCRQPLVQGQAEGFEPRGISLDANLA